MPYTDKGLADTEAHFDVQPAVNASDRPTARILVIEDNPDNMALTVLLLESVGHAVLMAIDAEAGLAIARAELPDLILMDIHLPGMDGLEATAQLKRDPATRELPVIALTAMCMYGDEARIRAAGCDGYIAKPIGVQHFLSTITEHLAKAPLPL
jgi:two-component system cell cycle response regulator DivK